MLLHFLRYGVTGNPACRPVHVRVEYSTGESLEFEGEALGRLTDEIGRVLSYIVQAQIEKEPVYDNDDFRSNE